jgi:hypothetical protein
MRLLSLFLALATVASTAVTVSAQAVSEPRRMSVAIESDVLSYGLAGYSGIISVSFARGLQVALGAGRYDVPTFLLEGDANYDTARWKATATSIQVLRATYRFNGPMKDGFALGAIILNQNWRLSGERVTGETKFQPLSVGLTAGYYIHLGKHLYLYPTTAFTYNTVASGTASLQGQAYRVAKWAPNGSLHMGWEWTR